MFIVEYCHTGYVRPTPAWGLGHNLTPPWAKGTLTPGLVTVLLQQLRKWSTAYNIIQSTSIEHVALFILRNIMSIFETNKFYNYSKFWYLHDDLNLKIQLTVNIRHPSEAE